MKREEDIEIKANKKKKRSKTKGIDEIQDVENAYVKKKNSLL